VLSHFRVGAVFFLIIVFGLLGTNVGEG